MNNESGIAYEEREYHNFTGVIMWGENEGIVESANFRLILSENSICYIEFFSGIWKKGVWLHGVWQGGTWEDGRWERGLWDNGIWKNGVWEYGTWYGGTWYGGIWKGGIWYGGVDRNGKFHKTSPVRWRKVK